MRLNVETAAEVKKLVHELLGDRIEAWKKEASSDALVQAITAMRPTKEPAAKDKGLMAGRFLRAVAAGRSPEGAAKFARDKWGDEEMAKALSASSATAGGILVPTQFSTDIIELLRERAIFRSLNPVILPMPTGSMTIPGIAGGATAAYIGENQAPTTSEQTFRQVSLQWKKLAASVPMSNDLLRFEAVGADAMVRDDAVAAMAYREDQAFLRDDGTAYTPKGVRYQMPAANAVAMTATPTLAKITADLANAILRLRNANVRMIRPAWLMAPRTELCLKTIRDTNGNLVFAAEMLTGKLLGMPYASSNVVPINLGSSESEVYLMDMADVVIGEANTLEVSATDVGAYVDASGNVQAAFSLDQTVIKVLAHHDLGVRHPESLTCITGVTWAPGAP